VEDNDEVNMGTDFVYQWLNCDEHAATDIKYSLRSLEQNWLGNLRVTVVGDRPKDFGQMFHIPHQPVQTPHQQRALDAVRKMEAVLGARHIQERFVMMHDDHYLLRPMDEMYVMRRRAVSEIDPLWEPTDANRKHKRLLYETAKALREKGFTRVWNYETHIPRMYEKRKMAEVIDIYRPAGNRLLLATLYYNHHYRHQEPELMHPYDDCKVAFFGSREKHTVPPPLTSDTDAAMAYYAQALIGKHFMNHNNRGIADFNLQYLRHSLWPEPSVFEPPPQPTLTIAR
jgi:hypothetical protein